MDSKVITGKGKLAEARGAMDELDIFSILAHLKCLQSAYVTILLTSSKKIHFQNISLLSGTFWCRATGMKLIFRKMFLNGHTFIKLSLLLHSFCTGYKRLYLNHV